MKGFQSTQQKGNDMLNFKKYGRMSSSKTEEQFRLDAFEALNLDETPENNEMFQRAWSYGYGGGYEEVFEHLRDLVAIIRENDNDI